MSLQCEYVHPTVRRRCHREMFPPRPTLLLRAPRQATEAQPRSPAPEGIVSETMTGTCTLTVKRSRSGWRIVAYVNTPGTETAILGREYKTETAAFASLDEHMQTVVKTLDGLGLQRGKPYA